MKRIVLLLALLIGVTASAQLKVKVNGKLITEATVLKAEDIKTMEVAFDKPKKLSYYGTGRLILFIDFVGEKDEIIESYWITKDGTNAVESFLADVNTFYTMPSDATKNADFEEGDRILGGSGINYKLMYFGKYYKYKNIKMRVSFGFRDKIGYQKYGDLVALLKAQWYTIDNTTLYTEGQKQREIEKVEEDAKKAEADKKAAADKAAAEAEAKKGKAKKVLKGVLGF